MAFDSHTRNKLQRMVGACRRLLTDEFDDQLQGLYGIYAQDGRVLELEKLTTLDDDHYQIATLLRDRAKHLTSGMASEKQPLAEAVRRVLREQAFTLLNRFAALRMAEERGFLQECVGQGLKSKGFQVFETVARSGLGGAYERYVTFIHGVFDELSLDLGVLFDRWSPFGLLFPREPALLNFFDLLNDPELKPLWKENETVGWIYQYFNGNDVKEMREAAKGGAPRNSRELAVRNQFFTPRYVVEFLCDNTLGRVWYEMTRGKTKLREQCRYLVRRPNEIFLKPEEVSPKQPTQDSPSQEDLLKQPVHIPHRLLKDPRTILMLDPACGSMHFGLYAFDLFEVIYEEAWELEKCGAEFQSRPPEMLSLQEAYGTKEDFLKDVPRLIIEHNLHGIDIDPRCVQIAGLSLWLRAQKAWQELLLKPAERPAIRRSNIVCAEPMPGENQLLADFVEKEFPAEERGVFLRLMEAIFDKMQLAGEAGALLKIEEDIRSGITEAKKLWKEGPHLEQSKLFAEVEPSKQKELAIDLSGITDEQFWDSAESRIYEALHDYAEQAENGGGFQRRLFAEDAARGFAFIDVCSKRYDVALMNPPFGSAPQARKAWMRAQFPVCGENILISFICRSLATLARGGLMGCITDRSWLQKFDYRKFRAWILEGRRLTTAVDLGWEVLDAANVETAASLFTVGETPTILFGNDASREEANRLVFPFASCHLHTPAFFKVIPNNALAYSIHPTVYKWFAEDAKIQGSLITFQGGINSGDSFRTGRCSWEVHPSDIGLESMWAFVQAGSPYSPFYYPTSMVTLSENKTFRTILSNPTARTPAAEFYGRPGIAYGKRTDFMYSYPMPAGGAFSWEGQAGFADNGDSSTLYRALAFTNSSTFIALANLVAGQHKYAGYLNTICCLLPEPFGEDQVARELVRKLLTLDTANETSPHFIVSTASELLNPALPRNIRCERASEFVRWVREQHDAISTGIESALHVESVFQPTPAYDHFELLFDDNYDARLALKTAIGYGLGCAFGRWDIRIATGAKAVPKLPDPFAPLPACPPGQLQNLLGLPARQEDIASDYPVRIPWDGILVDDCDKSGTSTHRFDIEFLVRKVIETIWKDRAESIEHEACELLGVKSLRDYFRKPTGFFADHLKRYSKSRRQAPIYWPLSTASGSYTLWIYYHRLTDQTLFQCVNEFVKPKLEEVNRDIERLRGELQRADGGSSKQRETLEELEDFAIELQEFHDELLRVAGLPYKPNLNDGVLITASPLWKLFRMPKWQKDVKACWEALEGEEYEWAHLAYSIWPDRVKKVCKTDRSIAIAHGLEDLCEVKAPEKKAKKIEQAGKQPELPTQLTPRPPSVAIRESQTVRDETTPPTPINQTDRSEVLCVIRQVFNSGGARDRETAMRDVAQALGFQRLGSHVREVLDTDLLTAVRRGILVNDNGLLSLGASDVRDYERGSMKPDFLSAIGRAWIERQEAIRLFARWLGYARTGPVIEDTARSLINGLIREGRLEKDGDRIRRVS